MSGTIDSALACAALESAWQQRRPDSSVLVHTDRGSVYASHAYRKVAARLGITMSMSRTANAWDNAVVESFFKSLKVERIERVRYETRAQARLDIVDWIEGFYNRSRIHTTLGGLTPVEYEQRLKAA